MKPETLIRLKRFTVITLVSTGVAAFILHLLLWFYWLDHNPASPKPETGEIYFLNHHGYHFYVTKTQSMLEGLLNDAFVILACAGSILNLYWKVVRDPSESVPKKLY